jgi:hypothetical protein
LKQDNGIEVREAELRVVSIVKGVAPKVIRFRHSAPPSNLPMSPGPRASPPTISPVRPLGAIITALRIATYYVRHLGENEWERYPFPTFDAGRTYLVVATKGADGTYRAAENSQGYGLQQGVLLAADAKAHRGATLTDAAWAELLALLKRADESDVVEAIRRLDDMSGGP